MNKYSRQRELILKILDENRVHPTAETVFELIKKQIPNVSLATVYRNLNLLSEKGTIRCLEGMDGTSRFDADISEHHHFVCKICGNIFDISGKAFPNIINSVSAKTGFIIDSCDVTFNGTCNNCITKN